MFKTIAIGVTFAVSYLALGASEPDYAASIAEPVTPTYYRPPTTTVADDVGHVNSPPPAAVVVTTTGVWADSRRQPVTVSAQEVPVEEPQPAPIEEPGIMHHCPQFEAEAVRQGWPIDQLDRLDHIMWRESRCRPDAYNPDDPAGGSYGLLQINGFWSRPSTFWPDGWLQTKIGLTAVEELYDPATNLRAALFIYNNSGWNPWSSTDPGATANNPAPLAPTP